MLIVLCQWVPAMLSMSCDVNKERNVLLTKLNVTSLTASKLYTFNIQLLFICSSICTSEESCYYLTFDSANYICTIYSQGSTSYNVSQFHIYGVQIRMHKVSYQTKYVSNHYYFLSTRVLAINYITLRLTTYALTVE